jgi:S-adenosylmethionine synthetase
MKKDFMFTSESVTEGHPDKLCDQISDAIVDDYLRQDCYARIRTECAVSSAVVFIAARSSSTATVDLSRAARRVIEEVGYDESDFNARSCSILTIPQEQPLEQQSRFDERELSEKALDKIPVKNQVTVFGFACDQTPMLMPLPIWLAHNLSKHLSAVRLQGVLPYLMPDGRVQVGVEFKDRRPYRIYSVTVEASQKKAREPSMKKLQADIVEGVITPVFETEEIKPDKKTRIFVNPDGPVVVGGPSRHSGLTGRKSAVDMYGEYARQSAKALSGKDPLRIDRVGAYVARYAAKNVVAAGLASECEVTLSYALGLPKPVSLQVDTLGTGIIPDPDIGSLVKKHFDFRLAGILKAFDLRHLPSVHPGGFYQKLAAYGHVGRFDLNLPWESTDKAPLLSSK